MSTNNGTYSESHGRDLYAPGNPPGPGSTWTPLPPYHMTTPPADSPAPKPVPETSHKAARQAASEAAAACSTFSSTTTTDRHRAFGHCF